MAAMASLTHLSREERIGLGVAAVAHVALLAALMFDAWSDRKPVERQQRMEVSLASDVALEATAPVPAVNTQAAVAPELAPVPERAVETPPEPVVREEPRPTPQPQTRARPEPAPRPQPEQRETRRATGSRIGADFLQGASTGERSDNRGAPATTFGPTERASLRSAISRQLRPHWNAPQGVDVELLVTTLDWDLNPDGSLAGRPRLRAQSGETDSNRAQAARHAELAIRAVQLAAPFDLPEEYYEHWRRIRDWSFDRNTSR